MHNCPQFIIAYYAILRAGGMVVPLNSLIVTNELRYYLQDSQTRIAFASQDLYPQIAPLLAGRCSRPRDPGRLLGVQWRARRGACS